MGDEGAKPWKKTEDIPRRFDELPPEPEWVPVADVIRTHREEEARQEAQKPKIKPPVDSDSESETKANYGNRSKERKTPIVHKEHEETKKNVTSKKFDNISMPPTVDNVTRSMVDWALNTDHYPKKAPRSPSHHKDSSKPLAGKQKPSHLLQEKSFAVKEGPSGKQPSRTSRDGNRNHAPPHKGYGSPPDVLSSPSGQKTPGYQPSAARMRTQQPTSNHNVQRPQYDEPSPDYDDENYDAYYSRYDEQYYHEGRTDEEYYYEERGYEDGGAVDPYLYDSGPAYDYNYDEYPPYDTQQGYTDPQGDFGGYEYSEPQYLYEGPRSGYPQPSPHYGPMPYEQPRGQQRSSYDVLY